MNEPAAGFANLRIINAGVCPINAFGVGLNTEVPATEVWKTHINSLFFKDSDNNDNSMLKGAV